MDGDVQRWPRRVPGGGHAMRRAQSSTNAPPSLDEISSARVGARIPVEEAA